MKDIIKVLAVNDPAVYAYTKESSVGITKNGKKIMKRKIKEIHGTKLIMKCLKEQKEYQL